MKHLVRDILSGKYFNPKDGGWYTWEYIQDYEMCEDCILEEIEARKVASLESSVRTPCELVNIYV